MQQMRLPVLEAIVKHAPLCLRVQRQPDELFNLLAGAIAAVLVLVVPLLLSFLAMPGLRRFLLVTHPASGALCVYNSQHTPWRRPTFMPIHDINTGNSKTMWVPWSMSVVTTPGLCCGPESAPFKTAKTAS